MKEWAVVTPDYAAFSSETSIYVSDYTESRPQYVKLKHLFHHAS